MYDPYLKHLWPMFAFYALLIYWSNWNSEKIAMNQHPQLFYLIFSSILHDKIFRKTSISYPLIRTRIHAYQGLMLVLCYRILKTIEIHRNLGMKWAKGIKYPQPAITCSKLTIEILGGRSGVFIVNFEHISHLVLAFLLLTLYK